MEATHFSSPHGLFPDTGSGSPGSGNVPGCVSGSASTHGLTFTQSVYDVGMSYPPTSPANDTESAHDDVRAPPPVNSPVSGPGVPQTEPEQDTIGLAIERLDKIADTSIDEDTADDLTSDHAADGRSESSTADTLLKPNSTVPPQDDPVVTEKVSSGASNSSQEQQSVTTNNASNAPGDLSPVEPQQDDTLKSEPKGPKSVTFNRTPVSQVYEASPATEYILSPRRSPLGDSDEYSEPEELYPASAWDKYHNATLGQERTSYLFPGGVVAQYPSLAVHTLGGLTELGPHPNHSLPSEIIRIDSVDDKDMALFSRDIDASWRFYTYIFPSVAFKMHGRWSFSMLFQKNKLETKSCRSRDWDLEEREPVKREEYIYVTVVDTRCFEDGSEDDVPDDCGLDGTADDDAATDGMIEQREISVTLVSRDTAGLGDKTDFLYSTPAFPEITRITNALLRYPEWRCNPNMGMDSRFLRLIKGRFLDFTDPDGNWWRVVENRKNLYDRKDVELITLRES